MLLSRLKAKGCKLVDAVLDTNIRIPRSGHDERRLNVGKYHSFSQNLSKLTKGLRDKKRRSKRGKARKQYEKNASFC